MTVLVTGATSGIGLETVKHILTHSDRNVILGARSFDKGQVAKQSLVKSGVDDGSRINIVLLDVASYESVAKLYDWLTQQNISLSGLVNNAGIGGIQYAPKDVMSVNLHGVKRVFDACLPFFIPNARVVNISSGAGPSFMGKRSDDFLKQLLNHNVTWQEILECEVTFLKGYQVEESAFLPSVYGFSKACVNALTVCLANENPSLCINACSPGFIDTKLTRPFLDRNQSPASVGMHPPSYAMTVVNHLLFNDISNRGHYFGSDAKRSPLGCYRSPGDPEFTG